MSLDATLGKGIEQMRAGEVRNKDGSSALAPSEVASPVGSLAAAHGSLPVSELKEIVDAWVAYRRAVTWDEQVCSYEQWDKCDDRIMAAIGKLEAAISRQPEENH